MKQPRHKRLKFWRLSRMLSNLYLLVIISNWDQFTSVKSHNVNLCSIDLWKETLKIKSCFRLNIVCILNYLKYLTCFFTITELHLDTEWIITQNSFIESNRFCLLTVKQRKEVTEPHILIQKNRKLLYRYLDTCVTHTNMIRLSLALFPHIKARFRRWSRT